MWGCVGALANSDICFTAVLFLDAQHLSGQEPSQGLEIEFADPQSSFDFAMAAVQSGDVVGAISALERVLRLDPERDNIRADLGYLYLEAGNPVKAEQLLTEARAAAGIPPDRAQQVDIWLQEARNAQRPYKISGSSTVGFRYDTNATGGPSDLPNITSGASEEDFSIVATANASYIFDFGYQDGPTLEILPRAYVSQHEKEVSTDVLHLGVEVGLPVTTEPNGRVRPFVTVNSTSLKGEAYLFEYGAGLEAARGLNDRIRANVRASVVLQDFQNSPEYPNATDRDGLEFSVSAGLDRELGLNSIGSLFVNAVRKDARQPFEAYQGLALAFRFPASSITL